MHTGIAAAIYATGGAVAWPYTLGKAFGAAAGGYGGALLARRIPASWLRAGITAIGAAMTAAFFAR